MPLSLTRNQVLSVSEHYKGVIYDNNFIVVLGISNTAGTFAAIIGTVGTGFFVELVGSFQGFLLLTSILYFLSALFYALFSTGERVNFDETGQFHTWLCQFFELSYFSLWGSKFIFWLFPDGVT